jgi:hypothetical protein
MGSTGFPDLFVVEPLNQHTHTIILLHGRGSNGAEFAEELFEARSSAGMLLEDHFSSFKWVSPLVKTDILQPSKKIRLNGSIYDLYLIPNSTLRYRSKESSHL